MFKPFSEVAFRGSWSQAFRAPTLVQLYSTQYLVLTEVPDSTVPSGQTLSLVRSGGNAALRPETANSWTTGFEFKPTFIPNFSLTADYFHIDFSNRIASLSTINTTLLSSPIYAPLVTREPSVSALSALTSAPGVQFLNETEGAYDPTQVGALIDERYLNISSQDISGVDLLVNYSADVGIGKLTAFLDGAYLQLKQQITSTAPNEEVAGLAFNPARFRARTGTTLSTGPVAATLIINWTGPFQNNYITPQEAVVSQATVDAQVAYTFRGDGWFGGFRASLSVQNIFDKNPPYVNFDTATYPSYHYDTLNANPVGRYFSARLSKAFGASNAH
jgi:outer membrane receptor protein involved in Fe transport